MKHYIVDTPYKQRAVSEDEMLSTYMRAKTLYNRDGRRGRLSILVVANTMSISIREASHLIRLKIENLDSFDW